MATTLKLRMDIKKLKGALSSKSIPAPIKAKLKAQLDKAQNELKAMQSGGKPRKISTTKGTQTALTSLQKLINKKKYSVYKGKGIDLKKDASVPAKPFGYRFTGKNNFTIPTKEQIRKGLIIVGAVLLDRKN